MRELKELENFHFGKHLAQYSPKCDMKEILSPDPKKIPWISMQEIIQLYNQDYQENINFNKIEKLVRNIKFFDKYKKGMRYTMLRWSKLMYFKRGDYIFKQGSYGEKMYVILRGSTCSF